MTPEIALVASCALTALALALGVLERARMRRGPSAPLDMLGAALALWSGLMAVIGWSWLIAGVLR